MRYEGWSGWGQTMLTEGLTEGLTKGLTTRLASLGQQGIL